MYASIEDFNQALVDDAVASLLVCAPIEGWPQVITSSRPYVSVQD